MLWEKGIFSHPSGEMINSVWLDGTFESGRFLSSSFNPYVTRNVNTFNFSDTCYWKNGIFDGGEFNISTWENGTFVSGTAVGMNWKNGIVNYMNAYNVLWEDGLWRNGNWNGSYFNLTRNGSVIDNYALQVLNNGMSVSGTSSLHVWNIFHNESLSDYTQSNTDPTQVIFSASSNDTPPAWGSTSSFGEVGTIPTTPITPIIPITPSTCGLISISGEGYGAYTDYDYLRGAIEITNNTSYNASQNGWVMVYGIRTSGLPTDLNGNLVPIYGSRTGLHGRGYPTIQIGNSTPVGLSQPSINFGIGYKNGSNPVVQIAYYTLLSGSSGQVYSLPTYLPGSHTLVINITSN